MKALGIIFSFVLLVSTAGMVIASFSVWDSSAFVKTMEIIIFIMSAIMMYNSVRNTNY